MAVGSGADNVNGVFMVFLEELDREFGGGRSEIPEAGYVNAFGFETGEDRAGAVGGGHDERFSLADVFGKVGGGVSEVEPWDRQSLAFADQEGGGQVGGDFAGLVDFAAGDDGLAAGGQGMDHDGGRSQDVNDDGYAASESPVRNEPGQEVNEYVSLFFWRQGRARFDDRETNTKPVKLRASAIAVAAACASRRRRRPREPGEL